jgi:hypothetical protein
MRNALNKQGYNPVIMSHIANDIAGEYLNAMATGKMAGSDARRIKAKMLDFSKHYNLPIKVLKRSVKNRVSKANFYELSVKMRVAARSPAEARRELTANMDLGDYVVGSPKIRRLRGVRLK